MTDPEPGWEHGSVRQTQVQCLPGGGSSSGVAQLADLDVLYREHGAAVWRIARHLGASPQDLDDVVHDVFLIAYRRRHDFDPTRSVRNWLFGIARNVVARSHTRVSRERRGLRAVSPPPVAPSPDPSIAVERGEAHEALLSFLDDLPRDQRDVFVLLEMEGESAPGVAQLLECSVNTVYSRLRLARRRFERFLARRAATRRRHD